MTTRRGFAGTLLLAAWVMGLGACGGRTEEWRYRMNVVVETPDGEKSGHSVRQIRYFEPGNYPALGESRPQLRAKGEAVAVELPGGKVLFALLTSGDGVVDYAGRDVAFLFRELGDTSIQLWPNPPKTTQPRINDPVPMLVTFKDITDPISVMRVDPDDLAASFGAGYRLKAITVQVTDEPVTVGIGKRLAWLEDTKIMANPGWGRLPLESRKAINGLFSGTVGQSK